MKVLLDECVTRYLKRDFAGHEVLTVEEAGFMARRNNDSGLMQVRVDVLTLAML
jgi:hypothetical protein